MRYEHHLSRAVARFPDKIAVVHGGARTSYADLERAARAFAVRLSGGGFSRGDRCVICLENRIDTAVAVFGTLMAGGVFTVVNPTTKQDKLTFILTDCTAHTLVHQASNATIAEQSAEEAGVEVAVDVDATPLLDAGAQHVTVPDHGGIAADLGLLVYTSGSTGRPKGVMMTHDNMQVASESITTLLDNTSDDVILSVLPLSFNYGLYQLLMSVRIAGTLVLERSFAFPLKVLQRIGAERATGFPLVPTIAALIVQHRNLDPAWTASVRYITNTAAALPPAHIERLREIFPNARIFSMYGVTESKRCTCLPPEELDRRPTSVGTAIPNTEVWLVDEQDRRITDADIVGELVVRGGHVMQGYWGNTAETDRALRAGPFPWERVLYTGDLFRQDADGYLYFVGRKDDILKSRGEKVSPTEVERVLYEIEGIAEAALVGVPDPVAGMALKAIIVLADGVTMPARDIVAHCSRRLEEYMVPRMVEFRSALPRTDTGKIRRQVLQAEAEGRTIDG